VAKTKKKYGKKFNVKASDVKVEHEKGHGWDYDDDEEDEDLYRLDFYDDAGKSYQAQLFFTYEGEWEERVYTAARLFLERDDRLMVGKPKREDSVRVYYACDCWPITGEEAVALVGSKTSAAVALMADKIAHVGSLPCDFEFLDETQCRDTVSSYLVARQAYWLGRRRGPCGETDSIYPQEEGE
jgi:hypothetical protein